MENNKYNHSIYAANMPFKDDTFDLIVIGKMLVYSDKPNNVIDETIRVLKNNGTV